MNAAEVYPCNKGFATSKYLSPDSRFDSESKRLIVLNIARGQDTRIPLKVRSRQQGSSLSFLC